MIGCEVRDQLIEKVADHFEVVAMTLWHRGTYGCVMKPLPNRRERPHIDKQVFSQVAAALSIAGPRIALGNPNHDAISFVSLLWEQNLLAV
jgi:hypothetical protein